MYFPQSGQAVVYNKSVTLSVINFIIIFGMMESMDNSSNNKFFFPAEWHPQSGIMLTWPYKHTDWQDDLQEVVRCYVKIAREISECQELIIVGHDRDIIRKQLTQCNLENIQIYEMPYNDTSHDHGSLFVFKNELPIMLDFRFNGWGNKFEAGLDDKICGNLWRQGAFNDRVQYQYEPSFVLEGGSLESDGAGTLLTTTACLLTETRNPGFTKDEIESFLIEKFGADRVLWLTHGELEGDDTDAHIDTLARFCNENTIAYVACNETQDPHFNSLKAMEEELQQFRTKQGYPYQLVPLPMADPAFDETGQRLPATYANFLIMNDKVLVPFYHSKKDEQAREILQSVFPERPVIGIDCRALIRQHGSLHCITMQLPKGTL